LYLNFLTVFSWVFSRNIADWLARVSNSSFNRYPMFAMVSRCIT